MGLGGYLKTSLRVAVAVAATSAMLASSAYAATEQPTVTSVQPNYGTTAGGTVVTILGNDLENVRSVHFGTVQGTIVEEECGGFCELVPYTMLTVRSPAHHSGTVDVTVTTSAGTSAIGDGDQFTYLKASSSALILTAADRYAPEGTPASGVLSFGACGSLQASGTLASNDMRKDTAHFTSTELTGGGCGEGGPIITGTLSAIQLAATGQLTVAANLSYDVTLDNCAYVVKKLTGTFSVPGFTEAGVSGMGRLAGHNGHSCPSELTIHATASLADLDTHGPFGAET